MAKGAASDQKAAPVARAIGISAIALGTLMFPSVSQAGPQQCASQVRAIWEDRVSLEFGNHENGWFQAALPEGVVNVWASSRRHYEFQMRVDREAADEDELIQWIGLFCEHFDADQAVVRAKHPAENILLFSCDCTSKEDS